MKKVLKVLKVILIIFLLMFIAMVVLQRVTNNKMSFFNYRLFTVISGSMMPKYEIGDVLISKQVEPSDIKKGDTITYLGSRGDFKNKVITHEVIDIKKQEEDYIFRAKGLANPVEDPVVHEDQIYGVVVYKTVILSFIYGIVGTKGGFFVLIVLPLMYTIISEIISSMLKKEEVKRKKI